MANVTIEIDTDNDAFHHDEYQEMSRILLQLSFEIGKGEMENRRIFATNGNMVGYMVVED